MSIPGIKNLIPVMSAKGGVGKSTTAVHLALALKLEGARVGLLDADIYGPSVALMLGSSQMRPEISEDKFVPIERYGLSTMSMAYLVEEDQAMIWRGPMVTSALMQLLFQTRWPELDYLIIDMPPGTGDIQLTLAQKIPVTGAVVVTTPQEVALIDARKAIAMLHKVRIPILGIIENMSVFGCPHCGHETPVFGSGGAKRLAEEQQVPLLGQMPLIPSMGEQLDVGLPPLVTDPEGEISQSYRKLAREVMQQVQQKRTSVKFPKITIEPI